MNFVAIECPQHCTECTYSADDAKTMCNVNKCEGDYANAKDGTCGGLMRSFQLFIYLLSFF